MNNILNLTIFNLSLLKLNKAHFLFFSAFIFALPNIAYAHAEQDSSGMLSGFLHPILGLDHFVAMLSVGLISAQIGGRYIWTVPSLFVIMMVFGGAMGALGIPLPMVEFWIAASVIVLGLGILFQQRYSPSRVIVMLFVAIFGVMHGHAHGMEMPGSASPAYYSFGFIMSTSLIHVLGVLLAHFLSSKESSSGSPIEYIGAGVIGAGVVILHGLIF